jgi:RNA polymerase sigma-70 factor (ECF subfamily)
MQAGGGGDRRGDWFPSTRWSLVRAAGERTGPRSRRALEELCQAYWPPVFAYVRSRARRTEEAQDLTQGFFTEFLGKKRYDRADPERGRFRAFLLASVKHYLANEQERAQAQKRGGGVSLLRLDPERIQALGAGPLPAETPARAFEKRWAMTLLERALSRLEQEGAGAVPAERFRRLKVYLTDDGPGISYRQVAAELGMTEAAVKVAVHRLRRRFGALLREEVAHTVGSPEMIDDEIRFLLAALRS